VVALSGTVAQDVRPLLATGAALFGRGEWLRDRAHQEEALWLLGQEALTLAPAPAPRAPLSVFAHGGYVAQRTDSSFSLLRCGPHGPHGHADQLHLEVVFDGERLSSDSGTYGYAERAWRNYFTSTPAHNTLWIDDTSQAELASTFHWARAPRGTLLRADPEMVVGEHDGYARWGITHRRAVTWAAPGVLLVCDMVRGAGVRTANLAWHFAPDLTLLREEHGIAVLRESRPVAQVQIFGAAPQFKVVKGALDPPQGWEAPGFGRKLPRPVLIATSHGELPCWFVTVISAGGAGRAECSADSDAIVVEMRSPVEASFKFPIGPERGA